MARLNVNPTRMELKKLKARLQTATRGHKLLKDKSDEMIRRFTALIKENKRMRAELEAELSDCLGKFATACAYSSKEEIDKVFSMPVSNVSATFAVRDVMNVEVPSIEVSETKSDASFLYAFAEMTSEADYSVGMVSALLPKMVLLAGTEKRMRMLAEEIERNKRRVNALEYIMIPQLEETIRYIKDKLDENERASVVRLMKVKGKQ